MKLKIEIEIEIIRPIMLLIAVILLLTRGFMKEVIDDMR